MDSYGKAQYSLARPRPLPSLLFCPFHQLYHSITYAHDLKLMIESRPKSLAACSYPNCTALASPALLPIHPPLYYYVSF